MTLVKGKATVLAGSRSPRCPDLCDLCGLLSPHCDWNVGLSAQRHPLGMASQATSAARLSAAVPRATLHPAGTACFAVLPGLFLSAWFGVFVLVPFLPVTTVRDSPCFPLPPFLHSLVVAAFPAL